MATLMCTGLLLRNLGHERNQPRRGSNARNGDSRKTVHTETGRVVVNVPRDREGSFEPQLIASCASENPAALDSTLYLRWHGN